MLNDPRIWGTNLKRREVVMINLFKQTTINMVQQCKHLLQDKNPVKMSLGITPQVQKEHERYSGRPLPCYKIQVVLQFAQIKRYNSHQTLVISLVRQVHN